MYKNIFITGKRNCGKSTLLNNILKEINLNYSGYKTLPYYVEGVESGYYLKSLAKHEKLSTIISVKVDKFHVIPIIENFNLIGSKVLKHSRENKKSNIIILDEVGFLENNSKEFKDEIIKCLECNKLVLGVLKKYNVEFLKNIANRKDTLVIDIENILYENRKILKDYLINLIKGYEIGG